MENSYIKLYADDFPADVWKSYCDACGDVSYDAEEITIFFDEDKVQSR